VPIAPRLRALAIEISSLEEKANNQSEMLDRVLDLHNDLTDWATNTEHSDAAREIMEILERYARPVASHLKTAV
jgi:hypothetical protein